MFYKLPRFRFDAKSLNNFRNHNHNIPRLRIANSYL